MDTSAVNYFDEVERMSKLIYNYGIMVVISGIFLVGVILFFIIFLKKWQSKRKEEHAKNNSALEAILKQNQDLVKTLTEVTMSLKQQPSSPEEHEEIMVRAYFNNRLQELLATTRELIKAEKIDCFIFTNGTHSLTGAYRFFRFVRSFTVTRRGSHVVSLIDMPISFLPDIFEKLSQNDVLSLWEHHNTFDDDSVSSAWVSSTKSDSIVLSLIHEEQTPVGFIAAYFGEDFSDEERKSIEEEIVELSIKAAVFISKEEGE